MATEPRKDILNVWMTGTAECEHFYSCVYCGVREYAMHDEDVWTILAFECAACGGRWNVDEEGMVTPCGRT